jgi:GTP-binding protein
MIRGQLSRGASSFVHIFTSERGLASKAKANVKGKGKGKSKRNPSCGTRSSTRAIKENQVPTTQRIPSKLSAAASASIQPQNAVVPAAYLAITGSPNVYVAKCATEEYSIDARELFPEATIPPSFRRAEFHYMSPKLFDHELPKYNIPEVAVLGRSNVGKSTLINAITRRNLAKASKQPGRTQTVHYYGLMPSGKHSDPNKVSSAVGFLIDLPGYGFAKAPDKNVSNWQEVTQDFLLSRRDKGTLTRTLLLVDSRRGTSQFDRNIMGWFDEAEIPYTVVLTKADRVSVPQLIRFSNEVCMRYHSQLYQRKGSQGPIVHVTSSSKNRGIEELMASIDADFVGYYEGHQDAIVEESDFTQDDQMNDEESELGAP